MMRGLPTSLASVLAVMVLTVLLNIPAQSPFHAIAEASGDDTEAAPGLCEDGYVAPTPVSVTVSAVPIVVQSTTADYFVLYIDHPDMGNHGKPNKIAISVTRGEEGSTTLSDNLRALAPGKYRVEKYQVARPGDIDGDCVDDITELDDLGNYNPLNPATKLDINKGQTAIASREAFETLSYQAARVPDNVEQLDGLEFVKFSILNWHHPNPSVYFQNNNNIGIHRELIAELDKLGVEKPSLLVPLHGTIVYHPNAIAPDGSLGVYAYNFDLSYRPFKETAHLNQLLASAMPFLENELAYYPSVYNPYSFKDYKINKDKYDKSRVNIILAEDVLPDVDFIPLNQAEGYGRLRLMEDGDDPRPGDIPIYESLPNDLPRVAGSITTVPQTPLSHVNLRAIQNGVPNAFLRDILKTKKYKDLIGKHVYFAVTADGFTLRAATKAEVDAHHRKSRPTTAQTLTRDLTVTSITPLSDISFNDWDAFGVKAANMAELSKLNLPTGTVPTGYAVPFYFYDEFMKANGFYNDVDTMLADTDFQSDYSEQEDQLKKLRKKIKNGTTPDWIIKALEKMHATYPDGTSLRYRSSTNNEDLPAFNGAGLYSSKTQDPEETTKDGIDKSIKAVWASLWNYRAFLERDYYRVDHKSVAMGVLVHPNYSDELANGVAVSHDPITFLSNMYYVNTQIGEDLVTNPEAKSYPEQLLLDSKGKASVLTRSNHAKRGQLLMSDAQMVQLRNNLQTIHDRFAKLYDVKAGDQFAIEIEFKITAGNKLAIKQARPWVFADTISLKPLVSASFASTKVTEGSPLNLVLTRRGGVLSDPLDVDLIWTDPAGKIQGAAPTSMQFLSDKTSKKVTVPTILTNSVETDSVITVRIKAKSSYVIVGESEATATVVDNAAPTPEVSITGGSGVTEGGNASFTLTANPAPAADLDVSVTVSQNGDYGAATGQRTVTITADTASKTLTLPTTDDSTDEADGSITATLDTPAADAGYTVSSSQGAATVSIEDDDVPVVSITGGSGVTEGGNASFTLTANPVPAADLTVNVTVSQSGDYGATTGSQTVTIPTTGSATFTVGTTDDSTDEPDGSVTATLVDGADYDLDTTQTAATVSIADDDVPVVSITGGSGVTEGGNANFTITASPVPASDLTVSVTVTASGDYGATTGSRTVTIPTTGNATLTIGTTNDSTDEPDGSVTATLDTPAADAGYTVSTTQGAATVAVSDDDDAPVDAPPSYEVDPEVVAAVQYLASQTHHGTAHVNRWQRTLVALDALDAAGVTGGALTLSEARQNANTYSSPVWDQVVTELEAKEAFEAAQQTPPPTPEVSITSASSGTEGQPVTFTVSANPAPAVDLAVSATVATSGDYGVNAGARTVTITGGTTSKTLTLPTTDDSTDEPDGSVTLTLNTGNGYTLGQVSSKTAQVQDDDNPPQQQPVVTPVVSITGGSGVTEGENTSFTLTANPAPAADLDVNVTVSQSGDYGATTGSRTVTIPTTGSATLTIGTTDDSKDETDGSITATLVDGADYDLDTTQGAATVTVADDDDAPEDTSSYTVDPALIAEVQAHIDAFTARNHAAGIRDWNLILDRLEGRTPGMSDARIAAWLQDSTRYGWQDGIVTLPKVQAALAAMAAQQTQQTPPPTPEVNITAADDGTEGSNVTFTVSANPAPAADLAVSVTVTTSGDYGVNAGARTVTITGGTTSKTLTLPTTDDSTDEPDGSVTLTLNTGNGYTLGQVSSKTAQVQDDDNPPQQQPVVTPVVSITGGSGVTEGENASFTLTANPAPAADLDVSVTVSQSGDYGAATGQHTVTITADTASKTLTLPTTDDSTDEADGSITATLDTPAADAGYTVSSSQGAATVSIADDDVPVVSISGGAAVTEGGNASFTITASPVPAADLTVNVTVSQSGDYGATTGSRTVTIPTTGSATFTVGTTDDSTDEADGSVTATLVDGVDYDLGTNQAATVSVADDDVPVVSISGGAAVTEGGNASFTITASPVPAADLTVSVTVSQSGDYGATTGSRTVTVPTSGSVLLTVGTTDDSTDEADGSVTVTLVDGVDYDLGTSRAATVAVSDDDEAAPMPVSTVTISIEDASASESASDLVFRVTLSEASSEDVTVQWATLNSQSPDRARGGQGYAYDYWHARGEIVIRAGETSGTGAVWLNQDSRDEPDEVFTVTLSSPQGATIERDEGTMTIIDDD